MFYDVFGNIMLMYRCIFRTLLETNKPYLMNTMRMPAAQTLLLFAHSIDTDPLMTRIVFDSWLEVVFTDSASARLLLVCAMELRDWWSELLRHRLKQSNTIHACQFFRHCVIEPDV